MFEFQHSMNKLARRLLAVATLAALAACSGGGSPTVQMTGTVVADQPVGGGTISFAQPGAAAFAQGTVTSSGTFQVAAPVPDTAFVATVSGMVRTGGSALPGQLQAVIAPAEASQPIQVDLLTTLVAQTWSRLGSGASIADAQARVRTYLGLPAGSDLTAAAQTGFYPTEFLAVAQANGGLDAFVANAAGAMAQNASAQLDYRTQFRIVLAQQLVHKLVMGIAGVVPQPAN
jgi:hypothetical protein